MIPPDAEIRRTARREWILSELLSATGALHRAETGGEVRRVVGRVARAVHARTAQLFRLNNRADAHPSRIVITWSSSDTNQNGNGADITGSLLDVLGDWENKRPLRAPQLIEHRTLPSRQQVILCPVVIDEDLWGGMLFRPTSSAEGRWTEETATLLQPFARHMEAWIASNPEVFDAHWDMQKDGAAAGWPEVEANRLQRRVESQRALVEASKLLVSSEQFAMEEVLQIVGDTTGADYAYLLSIEPDDDASPSPLSAQDGAGRPPIELDSYTHYEWHADGRTRVHRGASAGQAGKTARPDGSTFAVPLLSSQHLLFGYLGIEFEDDTSPLKDEDVRLLNVLGDMLCAYLQRQITDRALRESEQRYRYFIGTISEAIWRIDFEVPIDTTEDPERIASAITRQGVMAECNHAFAQLLDVDEPDQLIGRSVDRLLAFTGQRIVQDLVDADFRLQRQEYATRNDAEEEARYFIVNTSEVVEEGKIVSVWGSTTEVTERVRLERRMVTALEQQQQRIGHDLHDSVGQLLAGVRMLAQNLEERHFEEGAPGHDQIQKVISYASEAAQHVEDLQRGLMPVQMEQGGLAQALRELASNTDVHPDVDCIYVHDGTTDVHDPEKKLQLYRITQEATNNALKHGNPTYIKIVLKATDSAWWVEVEDDGIGFDVNEAKRDPHALHSMQYRARSIDASLRIQSAPGQGTTVRCEIENDSP